MMPLPLQAFSHIDRYVFPITYYLNGTQSGQRITHCKIGKLSAALDRNTKNGKANGTKIKSLGIWYQANDY